ncbi:hypothetical protein EV182_006974 [Spiromyces aspiralis]|uniref:Uncharacterized protein n=1 Tax=Spiromyces aspiralis TaxID=68401 RepID=A0ACC1HA66_9FUNG|nr:hypothetical protein EV182_006974 [Spiromyces aspiralis]
MYVTDCLRGTLQLLEHPGGPALTQRVYNLDACSFSPADLVHEIRRQHSPDFSIEYAPDFRQQIADSWPYSIDGSAARRDWGWHPEIDSAATMTSIMLKQLKALCYGSSAALSSSTPPPPSPSSVAGEKLGAAASTNIIAAHAS